MYRFLISLILINVLFQINIFGQEISLFQQFNGHYDYTAIGNTLNQFENNLDRSFCETLPSSQASLNLSASSNIIASYLYWAGSGIADESILLNDLIVEAELVYNVDYNDDDNGLLTYFSCFADITEFVISQGNITYELSELDISQTLSTNPGYCENRTNFAGWAIYIIYEDDVLPINQISISQGLEIIDRNVREKTIILDNINVLDNQGAKIGFLAWEGDADLNFGETLSINQNLISNPPLNPADNAFNGTNSFTNSSTLYNCDIDVYDIQDNIAIGDTSVEIMLTTGDFDINNDLQADLIIINNIITVLNSQLPDATVQVDDYALECGNRNIELDYTVYNVNSTDYLPANTPISFYANNELIAQSQTQNIINIDGSENASIILNIPETIPDNFTLMVIVDDDGSGNGIVVELNETNNITVESIALIPLPQITQLLPLTECDLGFNTAIYDLTTQLDQITYDSLNNISFYDSLEDLIIEVNSILSPETYQNTDSPQTIFIRMDTLICYEIFQFDLLAENCPPFIPQGFSPNNDTFNDWFNIQGLYDIFERHELLIYNRYGTLIFVGDNSKRWEGKANRGLNNQNKLMPVGTYFYVLKLNDINYKVMTGWVYLNR